MKRRDLLKTALLGGAAAMTTGLTGCISAANAAGTGPAPARGGGTEPWSGKARNIIFLAYDGTGYENAAAAGYFSRRILQRPLLFERLHSEGYAGSAMTHSLTSVVTDSAAASSTWATGRKVVNPALSMYPDGTPLTTILELAKQSGRRTGLVTSTRITHATPAAWASKALHRDHEESVAQQYLDLKVDILLGGGRKPFDGRADGRDLFAEFRQRGYDVVGTGDQLAHSNGSRILGVFTPGMDHMPYEVDRRFQQDPAPSLAELTKKALEVLGGSDQGFVLQVEAGRIDHANHYSDPGALIWDWMAADDALQVIMEFVDENPDTLLLSASDHETGGSVVYGFGPWYLRSTQAFESLRNCRASHEWLVRYGLSRQPSASEVQDAVTRYLGIPINAEQSAELAALVGTRPLPREKWLGHPNAHTNQPDNSLGYLLSISPDWSPDRPNIIFATGNHTAGLVPAVLYGAMVPRGNLGIIDNTDLFRIMLDALGIEFENQMMTEEEALQIALDPAPEHEGMHTMTGVHV